MAYRHIRYIDHFYMWTIYKVVTIIFHDRVILCLLPHTCVPEDKNMSALTRGRAAGIVGIAGIYGIVQKAADSAHRLHYIAPDYYAALYAQDLEMMYFLIEPLFDRAEAFKNGTSDHNIINTIKKMIG